jgi:hypothetical protein
MYLWEEHRYLCRCPDSQDKARLRCPPKSSLFIYPAQLNPNRGFSGSAEGLVKAVSDFPDADQTANLILEGSMKCGEEIEVFR